jgi:predicted ATPase
VISLLRALLEERADLSAPSLRRLPEGLTERMAARIRNVDPGSRAVLELLAVFERPLSVAGLVVLTGLQLDQLGPILVGLVDGRAVAEGERGRELSYEVSHPLLREAVYQEISGTRKRVLHR